MITENDMAVLRALSKFYVLCRPQLQRLCFPHHKQGRATRKHLAKLFHQGLVQKHRTLIPFGEASSGCPVYWLSKHGTEVLASYFDDPRYLACNTRRPRADLLFHWLAIGDTHIAVEEAVAAADGVELVSWVNEWETVNKGDARQDHFYLHTVLSESPPLSCSPDAGFLLQVGKHRKVFYLEQDRNTSGVRSIAASKTPGYAELARRGSHQQHFPQATVEQFTVIAVTTGAGRRNRLADAVDGKPGANFWLFVSQDELTSDNFLFAPITYNTKKTPAPLIEQPVEELVT